MIYSRSQPPVGKLRFIISNIIMKLMAKNVDERYQSAFGVKADLEKCLENLRSFENLEGLNGELDFELAQNDFSGQFNLSQKLVESHHILCLRYQIKIP